MKNFGVAVVACALAVVVSCATTQTPAGTREHVLCAPLARVLGLEGYAVTLGDDVVYAGPPDVATRRHELAHVAQVRGFPSTGHNRAGAFFASYFWFHVRFGYLNNPYELEARAAETEAEGAP